MSLPVRVSRMGLKVGILLLLFPLIGFFYFGWRVMSHRELAVHSVVPGNFRPPAMIRNPVLILADYGQKRARVRGGVEMQIFINGTGMDSTCRVRFHPRYDFQVANALNPATLGTRLPPDLMPGPYDVVVRNDRGHSAMLREALEIYWVPRVERITPRRTYEGEQIKIIGDHFQSNVAVWVGEHRVKTVIWDSPQSLQARLQFDEELPPGLYDLRVSNGAPETLFTFDERLKPVEPDLDPSEKEFILPQSVEILPRPRVTEVYPREATYGEEIELTVKGDDFPEGASIVLMPNDISLKTTRVDSKNLQARLDLDLGMGGMYDLYLTMPDGASISVQPAALNIMPIIPQSVLVDVLLKEVTPETIERFRGLPGWKLMERRQTQPRSNYASRSAVLNQSAMVRMVLAANLRGEAKGERVENFSYRGQRLLPGEPVRVTLAGREVDGIVASRPEPVFFDWRELNEQGGAPAKKHD